MSELTLLVLRIGFLLLLWAFVFAIVYALRSDLFGQKVRRVAPPAAPAAPREADPFPPTPPTPTPQPKTDDPPAKRLVITSGSKEGLEIELTGEQLTIGRSSDSALVVRDDYTSTHHARLMLWDGQWMVQDLDSTNGTFLAGDRVSVPTPVPLNTPVSVGTTTFELRR